MRYYSGTANAEGVNTVTFARHILHRNQTSRLVPHSYMISRKKHATVAVTDVTYYTAYVLWITLMVFNSSLFARYIQGLIYTSTRYFCLILLLFSELTRAKSFKRSTIGLIIFVFFSYAILSSHETVLFDIAVFVYSSKDRDFRYTVGLSILLLSSLVLIIIVSASIGIIKNYTLWSGGRIRTYLGFRYALFPAQYIYLITCLVCYYRNDRFDARDAFVLIIANFFILYHTDSRLSFSFALILIIISLVVSRQKRFRLTATIHPILSKLLALAAASSFILSAILSIAVARLYDASIPWMTKLDHVSLLGGRLSISHRALASYPIKLWGREMHFSGAALDPYGRSGNLANYNTIDSLYVRMLINYGIVFTVLFIILFTAVTLQALKEKNVYLVLILMTIAFRSTIDNLSLHLQYDTFLLLIGMLMNTHLGPPLEDSRG